MMSLVSVDEPGAARWLSHRAVALRPNSNPNPNPPPKVALRLAERHVCYLVITPARWRCAWQSAPSKARASVATWPGFNPYPNPNLNPSPTLALTPTIIITLTR